MQYTETIHTIPPIKCIDRASQKSKAIDIPIQTPVAN